jgi:hypothetical protein
MERQRHRAGLRWNHGRCGGRFAVEEFGDEE